MVWCNGNTRDSGPLILSSNLSTTSGYNIHGAYSLMVERQLVTLLGASSNLVMYPSTHSLMEKLVATDHRMTVRICLGVQNKFGNAENKFYIRHMKSVEYNREYLGTIVTQENYRSLEDLNFHRKHLKSYLKGRDNFTHGWDLDEEGNKVSPKIHNVQQKITLSFDNQEGTRESLSFGSQAQLNYYLNRR